jgi:phospholipid/cholesterol/gamma-HCH transport system permease protein
MITREPEHLPPPTNAFGRMGRRAWMSCRNSGRALLMLAESALLVPLMFSRRSRYEVLYQMYVTGIKTLGVVTVVAMFTGMILALQMGIELRDFGQESRVGFLVTEIMFREMGPMMTALIIAASVGSAIAAQIATMTVSEEIAALEVMSINPARFIVMPRLVALVVMMPIVTVYMNVIGIVGGSVVGATQLDISLGSYFDFAFRFSRNKGLYVGLLKAAIFGVIICTVACHQGFSASQGAVGVGHAARRTVIISFLSILVVGYFLTRFFYV